MRHGTIFNQHREITGVGGYRTVLVGKLRVETEAYVSEYNCADCGRHRFVHSLSFNDVTLADGTPVEQSGGM